MTPDQYHFSIVYPEAFESFLESGWSEIDFKQASDGETKLVGVDPNGKEVEIDLPTGYEPGQVIPDDQMIRLLTANNVILKPLDVIGFRNSGFGEAWGFRDCEEPNHGPCLVKNHPGSADRKLYFYLNAERPQDTLLIVKDNGVRVDSARLSEVDNIFKLGDYMTTNGWFKV